MRHVSVTKSKNAVSCGDHRSRCRRRLWLQLPLRLSLNPFCGWCLHWMCTDCAGFRIRDRGRHVFIAAERSITGSNAGCSTGYNMTCWLFLWGSSGCWYTMTPSTQYGGWSTYWPLLCSGWGGCHMLSDSCNARIVQQRWGGGVPILDCRGYWTPSQGGISLASWYRNVSLSRGELVIPWRASLLLILTISKTSNISYGRSRGRVRDLVRHCPI